MSVSLLSLPVELLTIIVGYTAEDVLKLRWTCRSLKEFTWPAVESHFHSRTYMLSRHSLEYLLKISENHEFKLAVRRVAITTEHLPTPSPDDPEEHKKYHYDQTEFLKSGDALSTFIQILRNLEKCETIALELDGAWDSTSLEKKAAASLTSGVQSKDSQKFVIKAAQVIFQAMKEAEVSPKTLDLSWVALRYPGMLRALTLPSNEAWMRKVTRLEIRLHIEEDSDLFTEFIEPFTALQSFYLSFDPSDNPYPLDQFSTIIKFPNLHQFTVRNAECAPKDLKDVLHSHAKTLREIKLEEVCFEKLLDSWCSTIPEDSQITTLEFENCYIGEKLVQFQLSDGQGPSTEIRVSCDDPQSLCHTLKQLSWTLITPPSSPSSYHM